jgi:hypothetical protein
MLSNIQEKIKWLVRLNWAYEMGKHGEKVELWRDYERGDHALTLTSEMRAMLRIADGKDRQFGANYCPLIIGAMADRLTVQTIEGESDAATAWAADLLKQNRFDGMQMDVTASSLRDACTFIMVSWDNDLKRVVFTHELMWDGDTGVIPVYDRANKNMVAAIKVWYEGADDARRVNFYYPDRVEKYTADAAGAGLTPLVTDEDATWVDTQGKALGVPLVAIRNRARTGIPLGTSELEPVIPLQDILNENMMSMTATATLTGFPIRYALGFVPPANVSPGMWVVVGGGAEIPKDQLVEMGVLKQGDLVPFISQAEYLIDQISEVSRTPIMRNGSSTSASGESQKQRGEQLLSKVRQYQVPAGNAWEDVMALAAKVQDAFGATKAPASASWRCRWADAELRNEADAIKNIMLTSEVMGAEQTLREVGNVFGWDEMMIARIIASKASERTASLAALGGGLPGFARFAMPASFEASEMGQPP